MDVYTSLETAPFIKELDESEFMEFLSGLLDSDGTVTDRIVFYSASKSLRKSSA